MRAPAVVAMLVSLAVGLAGCSSGSGDGAPTAGPMSTARVQADAEALAWSPDAQLYIITGFEFASDELFDEAREEANDAQKASLVLDAGTVGDGQSPVWLFTYVSATAGSTFWVAADATGVRETDEDDTQVAGSGSCALGALPIDSPAILTGAATSAQYAATAVDADVLLTAQCANGESFWLVLHASGDNIAGYFVNATTGELAGENGFIPGLGPMWEGGVASGTANVMTASSTPLAIAKDHTTLKVIVSARTDVTPTNNPSVPGTTFEITLNGPGGTDTVTWTYTPNSQESDTLEVPAPAGDYTVEVSIATGLTSGFDVTWCTDGAVNLELIDNRACLA